MHRIEVKVAFYDSAEFWRQCDVKKIMAPLFLGAS